MAEMDEAVRRAADLICRAPSVAAFTGAGISVESGIPDFRSSDGLWSKYDPDQYCSYEAFKESPELFWEMAKEMQEMMVSANPNPAHLSLAELENMGKLNCVITQNVDNLHQRAGSKVVYELHGNASTTSCMSCDSKISTEQAFQQLDSGQLVPRCQTCGSVLKMDVVLFDEVLPHTAMEAAFKSVTSPDVVLLVVGTSLRVSPANGLVFQCLQSGGKIIICDPDPSVSGLATVSLVGKAGQVLPRLVDACRQVAARSSI